MPTPLTLRDIISFVLALSLLCARLHAGDDGALKNVEPLTNLDLSLKLHHKSFGEARAAIKNLAARAVNGRDPATMMEAHDILSKFRGGAENWLVKLGNSKDDVRQGASSIVLIPTVKLETSDFMYLAAVDAREILMEGPYISDDHIQAISGYQSVESLTVCDAKITGKGFDLANFSSLTILRLNKCSLINFRNLNTPNLELLDISNCTVVTTLLDDLKLTNLVDLRIHHSSITGNGLESIKRYPKLTRLSADISQLNDRAVEAINASQIERLKISYDKSTDNTLNNVKPKLRREIIVDAVRCKDSNEQ